MSERHNRRSIRLQGYDYSAAGAYFVTVCVKNRECLFGEIVDAEMRLNDAGRIVHDTWFALPDHYTGVETETFVVMPNHVHGIIVLNDCDVRADDIDVGAGFKPAHTTTTKRRHGLSEIVRGLKTFSARHINALRQTPGIALWQRNYYEHIIRNEDSLDRIRAYIADNPARWACDRENPEARPRKTEEKWEV